MAQEQQETKNEPQASMEAAKYAGFWIRFLAAFLDGIVISAAMSMVMAIFRQPYGFFNFAGSSGNLMWGEGWQSYSMTLLQWLYQILMLKYYNGATLGKMALRLKVVKTEGELDWVTIILRETIGKFVSGIILGIGYLMVAWDPKKQALHDKIAGTYVIRE